MAEWTAALRSWQDAKAPVWERLVIQRLSLRPRALRWLSARPDHIELTGAVSQAWGRPFKWPRKSRWRVLEARCYDTESTGPIMNLGAVWLRGVARDTILWTCEAGDMAKKEPHSIVGLITFFLIARKCLLHIRLGYSELPSNSWRFNTSFEGSADSVQFPLSQGRRVDRFGHLLARSFNRLWNRLSASVLLSAYRCKQSVKLIIT